MIKQLWLTLHVSVVLKTLLNALLDTQVYILPIKCYKFLELTKSHCDKKKEIITLP